MESQHIPFHPRKATQYPGDLTAENIKQIFANSADYWQQEIFIGGDPQKPATVISLVGMVNGDKINDHILKPLAQAPHLADMSQGEAFHRLHMGGIYNVAVLLRSTLDEVADDLLMGNVILAFPHQREMISCIAPSEDRRAISSPENEPLIKGAKDAFVESLRSNTAAVRRRIRVPELKIKEQIVGRRSRSLVDMIYIEGLTNPQFVAETEKRLEKIDIDAVLTTANLEEYLADTVKTPFPLIAYTERPDRFCGGLLEGRVGILVDGLPLGFLLPGTLNYFFKTSEDRAKNWMEASFLRVLRYLCMVITLFLPAMYVAAVNFHPEMLPAPLAWSIIQAKVDVPFSTIFEILILLLAFEILQEAGLRLPAAIGGAVSILGGLVVGSAAVEAKIVSPAVLIVVAIAGIAGYTMPSQDIAGALRLWRFVLVIAAALAGLFGVMVTAMILIHHLASLETLGVPYLSPFAASQKEQEGSVLRLPLPWVKLRDRAMETRDRRNQR